MNYEERLRGMFENYNQAQKQAIMTNEGPLLVVAGAGSGKTSVLIQHIIYLVKQLNIEPKNILAVTFTNKAANEIKERISKNVYLDEKAFYKNNHVWAGTFHSTCARILRRHISLLGFQNNFNIYDKNDSKRLIKKCIKSLNIDSKQYRLKTVCNIIDNSKNKLIDENIFSDNSIGFYNKIVGNIYKVYQKELMENQALDYNDLIMKTVQLFQEYPEILNFYQDKFKHILVDEYQDINHAQYVLIKLLSQKNKNLFVVGDPDQSIYRFRGAELSNIINFEEDFPECDIIKLEQNYRSSDTILKGASFVIKNNKYRKEKELWTSKKGGEKIKYYEANSAINEAEFIAREIDYLKKNENRNWSDFVILYRTNAQSRSFEEVFAKKSIPFRLIGGIRFYERKEIKNIVYLLKLIDNPFDKECCHRWLEMDKMGIGTKGIEKLNKIANQEQKSILDVLPDFIQNKGNRLNYENKEKIKKYLITFKTLKEKYNNNLYLLCEELIKKINYYNFLNEEDDVIRVENRIENVKTFLQSIREYEKINPQNNLNEFLTYISLISDVDNIDISEEGNVVNLMTLHCSKGLEFPVVFLTGLEEGIFPHNRSLSNQNELEEERRLCYVGMTRAMERLYLTYSWRRNFNGKTKFNQVSRFFNEIPKKYLEKSEIYSNDIIFSNKNKLGQENKYLEISDKIYHPDWQNGSIINKQKAGDDFYITVHFKDFGIKRLSLKYAPIKKIEKE